jgi:hypothetical protein
LTLALKRQDKIRLAFKIGRLASKNGELQWKSFHEETDRANILGGTYDARSTNTMNTRYSNSKHSQAMVDSVFRKDLSVLTPACQTVKSRGKSQVSNSFHMANPNPQPGANKFKGVRDVGYRYFYENADPLQEVIRFGRKVNYDQKMSNDELLNTHLAQIRERMHKTQTSREMKSKADQEFLQQIQNLERLEK